MNDVIYRQAAIDALDKVAEMFPYRIPGNAKTYRQYNEAWSDAIDAAENALEALPSAQPEKQHGRIFQEIVVKYPSYNPYPERKGKPYFSIKYTENGQEFIGYGTYKPEVLSEYLKEYFMPPAQPGCEDAVSREAVLDEIHRYMEERDYTIGLLDDNVCGLPSVTPKQPGWIPVTERLPERYDNYLITTEDEDTDIGTFHPEFKQWSICDADGFRLTYGVLAWCELPEPWEGDANDT